MPLSPSMNVIFDSHAAVAMNPGSKVNRPWSLTSGAMFSTSGPTVGDSASSSLLLPVATFVSVYFLDGMGDLVGSGEPVTLQRKNQGNGAARGRARCGRRDYCGLFIIG